MTNERIVEFVLKEIPDEQILKHCCSITGMTTLSANDARKRLKRALIEFSVDNVLSEIEKMTDKDYKTQSEGSRKSKSMAIVGLYLTVAYLAVKGIVKVNAVFSIAFGCLERDLALRGYDKGDYLALTKNVVLKDRVLIGEYNQLRDSIRDDATLPKEEKRARYKQLLPIQKKMHYDLHSYYAVYSNYTRATKLKVARGERTEDLLRSYRNKVEHLTVPARLSELVGCVEELGEITSYYSLYVYLLQKLLIKEQKRKCDFEDELLDVILNWDDEIAKGKAFSKPMLWVINVPFAYNMARYKNLSIENLFYGKY